ncbi:MAG: hypothetical protein U0350_13160 [Caldilineaceae bacterium]
MAQAEALSDEVSAWRATDGAASFAEIAEQVRLQRQGRMGQLLAALATQDGCGAWLAERTCPGWGGVGIIK